MAQQPLPRVLLTEGSDPIPLKWLRERAEVVEIPSTDPAFFDELKSAGGFLSAPTQR